MQTSKRPGGVAGQLVSQRGSRLEGHPFCPILLGFTNRSSVQSPCSCVHLYPLLTLQPYLRAGPQGSPMFGGVLFWRSTLGLDQVLLGKQSGKATLSYMGHARDSSAILCTWTRTSWVLVPIPPLQGNSQITYTHLLHVEIPTCFKELQSSSCLGEAPGSKPVIWPEKYFSHHNIWLAQEKY